MEAQATNSPVVLLSKIMDKIDFSKLERNV
jgi:hypothetical protein